MKTRIHLAWAALCGRPVMSKMKIGLDHEGNPMVTITGPRAVVCDNHTLRS